MSGLLAAGGGALLAALSLVMLGTVAVYSATGCFTVRPPAPWELWADVAVLLGSAAVGTALVARWTVSGVRP